MVSAEEILLLWLVIAEEMGLDQSSFERKIFSFSQSKNYEEIFLKT